jgi:hypothetical protein
MVDEKVRRERHGRIERQFILGWKKSIIFRRFPAWPARPSDKGRVKLATLEWLEARA